MKLKAETEALIEQMIKVETEGLIPPRTNPLEKSSPHYRHDWADMTDPEKVMFLRRLGERRVHWVVKGLLAEYQERETKRRTIKDRLVDLWSRDRTALQHE